MTRPIRAAALATSWYLVVVGGASALGILLPFQSTAIHCRETIGGIIKAGGSLIDADGFIIWNWGVLYFFALPLAAFLMGSYFRLLDNALLALDDVIKPVGSSEKPFTQFLVERVRLQWAAWISPLTLAAPILLTAIADGRDILAPLQSGAILPSCALDWSTVGYAAHHSMPSLWYLAFNLTAWMMQIFLGYCGILVLTLTGGTLGTVFRYGLGGHSIVDAFLAPGAQPAPERYRPKWQYGKARCGLETLDVVFLLFVGLNLFALVASAASIFVNVYLRKGPTVGSFVLALGTMFFIPLSFSWVFVPYFIHFPEDIPKDEVMTEPDCHKPSPWPFGSEKLSWTVIGIAAGC